MLRNFWKSEKMVIKKLQRTTYHRPLKHLPSFRCVCSCWRYITVSVAWTGKRTRHTRRRRNLELPHWHGFHQHMWDRERERRVDGVERERGRERLSVCCAFLGERGDRSADRINKIQINTHDKARSLFERNKQVQCRLFFLIPTLGHPRVSVCTAHKDRLRD